MRDIRRLFIDETTPIERALEVIQNGGAGITFVTDEGDRLVGTITDGDVRRAILRKIPLSEPVSRLMENRPADYPRPVTAPVGTSRARLRLLMETKVVRQIPLLDEEGRIRDVVLWTELREAPESLPVTAVIMAGGRGRRLHPLTARVPKPMLLLDDRPLIERTVERLRDAGIGDIYVALNYKPHAIRDHFRDGSEWGVRIRYLHEDVPLGTAGALRLLPESRETILVINGDILTDLDFRLMHDFHRSHGACATLGVRIYENEIPYGVVQTDDIFVTAVVEKPQQACIINAGIYMLAVRAAERIPERGRFDMTSLVEELLRAGEKVVSFPIQEYWLDVGRPADYERARRDAAQGRIR